MSLFSVVSTTQSKLIEKSKGVHHSHLLKQNLSGFLIDFRSGMRIQIHGTSSIKSSSVDDIFVVPVFIFLPSMHLTFSETLIPDSRSFFLANQLRFAVGRPFDTNDLAQPLFSQHLYLYTGHCKHGSMCIKPGFTFAYFYQQRHLKSNHIFHCIFNHFTKFILLFFQCIKDKFIVNCQDHF